MPPKKQETIKQRVTVVERGPDIGRPIAPRAMLRLAVLRVSMHIVSIEADLNVVLAVILRLAG